MIGGAGSLIWNGSVHAVMNRFFPIFALVLLIASAVETQTTNHVATNDVVRLRVTVLDVAPLRGFKGSLTPTSDIDSRFALTVRIESCAPAITNLKSGTIVTFAVHSPSMFLGGTAEKGKPYEIAMPRKRAIDLISEDNANQRSRADAGWRVLFALARPRPPDVRPG